MSAKLTVIFYIILCLEAGIVLTLLPWMHPFGLGDWGDNFFLLYASQKVGLQGLQHAVSSGWVRGAVTGLGLLNLSMAFWEMAHFRQTVRRLQSHEASATAMTTTATVPVAATPATAATTAAHANPPMPPTTDHAAQPPTSGDIPDYGRRDDARHNSVE